MADRTLIERSRTLRRLVSGDIEWTAAQFSSFMRAAHDLCNAVDTAEATWKTEGKPDLGKLVMITIRSDIRVRVAMWQGFVWLTEEGVAIKPERVIAYREMLAPYQPEVDRG